MDATLDEQGLPLEQATARLHAVSARAVENLQDAIEAGDRKYSRQSLKSLGFVDRRKAAKR